MSRPASDAANVDDEGRVFDVLEAGDSFDLGDDIYVPCPGGGIDDLCAQAQGLDPAVDGCGLCTIGGPFDA